MRSLESIVADGFRISDLDKKRTDLAFASARLALRAYAATYSAVHRELRDHDGSTRSESEQQEVDQRTPPAYWDACAEAILHFQHFCELLIKGVLRSRHELLATDASGKHVLLDKLLRNEVPDSVEDLKLNTVEAGLMLERFCELAKANRIDPSLAFIAASKDFLAKLNTLRNRLWHRGVFVLRYRALDEFFGGHALPFLIAVTAVPRYADLGHVWRHKPLSCGIAPIDGIVAEFKKPTWDLGRVALLKEMMRAAFENPLEPDLPEWLGDDNEEHRFRVELVAKESTGRRNIERVTGCPVCGLQTLAIASDVFDDPEEKVAPVWYTYEARCFGCTFAIGTSVENASKYGYAFGDYWEQR